MNNIEWAEKLYQENYERLFALGFAFVSGNPMQVQKLEDAIQEVFYELIKKSDDLVNHQNINGWLVVTLRLKLKEQYKSQKRDEKWREFSFDDDHRDVAIHEAEKSLSQEDMLKVIIEEEQVRQLEELLGKENAAIFIKYCVNKEPTAVVAREFGLTENALWVKVNRLRKKILANQDLFLAVSLIFFKTL